MLQMHIVCSWFVIDSLTLSESTLVASGPLTGWIRAAAVWEASGEGDEQTLNTFWKVIPTGTNKGHLIIDRLM